MHTNFHTDLNLALISHPVHSSALHAPADHRLVGWEEQEENEKESWKKRRRAFSQWRSYRKTFPALQCSKQNFLTFFFYALISPRESLLSLVLLFSVVLIAASHNVLHSDFSLHLGSDAFVHVRGFVLSWIKGVELNKAWHLEVMRHTMRQGKQMQLPVLPSAHIPTFQHTHRHA